MYMYGNIDGCLSSNFWFAGRMKISSVWSKPSSDAAPIFVTLEYSEKEGRDIFDYNR